MTGSPGTKSQTPRVTMMQIAKAVGCSQATVSFVLNDVSHVKISLELRTRVLSTAKSMGYGAASPMRRAAMELAGGSCIGVIMDQFVPMPTAFAAAERGFYGPHDEDITILAVQTQGRAEQERIAVARLLRAGAQGIVYESFLTRRVFLEPFFDDLRVPVVLANCYTSDGRFPSVIPDEIDGARLAIAKLASLGHRRIAIVTGRPGEEVTRDRLIGYRQALAEVGVPFDGQLVMAGDGSLSSGHEAARRLLSIADGPTAILCHNFRTAAGCFDAARDVGLRIPDDLSVIGYDDNLLPEYLRPQLTTLELPRWSMGAWAVRQASLPFSMAVEPHAVRRLGYALVERASCGRLL